MNLWMDRWPTHVRLHHFARNDLLLLIIFSFLWTCDGFYLRNMLMELLNSIFTIQSINKNNNNINHNNSSATCVGLSYLQIPFANYRGVIYDAHSVLYPLRGSQLIP